MAKQQSKPAKAARSEEYDSKAVLSVLNRILEMELAGIVRYTHYSLMVFGYNRIPIVSWLRAQATEGMAHAQQAGEWITHLGGHPSLAIGPLLETHDHDIGNILRESLEHELETLELYRELLRLTADRAVMLEEYARGMILSEEMHCGEVDKMLRKPGDTKSVQG
ncbi:MAG TPA: ferritin-like domain-containing protein [Planctomycetota bacterium]|nr:ferritin-like domain-containing protein [Planctomycetota bacterium]